MSEAIKGVEGNEGEGGREGRREGGREGGRGSGREAEGVVARWCARGAR